MSVPKLNQLSDTIRTVEWDELPVRARSIRADFNPLDEGVLMKHQAECISLPHAIIAHPKGRRTGITFAWALNSTVITASSKEAGGDNVYYIGDTKSKGLEFIGYCAKFSRLIAEAQGQGISSIEEFLFEDQDEKGNTKYITSYRIRYSSGFQICALSSKPENIRGLQGIVIIDEAAFHANVQNVLDAATALLIWGGRIIVISSHNGKNNPFNQFCKDIEEGRYGEDATVFRVTFDDAVANGLYERRCMMKGEAPTEEGKKKWYLGIRKGYGPRKAAMREELDAIPRDGAGIAIPGIWIDNSMREVRPVVRLALDEDFVDKTLEERVIWCDQWIKENIDPLIKLLDPTLQHVFAQDFARHRHFSIIKPLAVMTDLRIFCPWVIEMNKVPTRQQEQILWYIVDRLPNFRGGAMDATGPGQTLAEYTADRYGHEVIHQVNLSRSWYGIWMPKMIQWFEDGVIDLPRDANIEQDLRAVVDIDGIKMVPNVTQKDLKEPELYRHGDSAVTLCLGCFARYNMKMPLPIDFQTTGRRASLNALGDTATQINNDRGFGVVSGNNDYRGYD